MGPRKGGGGKGNWGTITDYYDESEIPLGKSFNDPALESNSVDYSKVRVRNHAAPDH